MTLRVPSARPETYVRVVRIDVAELGGRCTLERYPPNDWQARVWAVLGNAIEQAQEAVLDLLGEGGGGILFLVPFASNDPADRAAVSGLHGLARSIAKEYGRKNIRCNVIVGRSSHVEMLLETNGAITGELLVIEDEIETGSGLD